MSFAAVGQLLRSGPGTAPPTRTCLVLGMAGAALMGTALGGSSGEPWLGVFAAVKVPLLLALCALLCLPSWYVVNSVLGLRDDLGAALRALLAAQGVLGVTLGALAPLAVFAALSLGNPYLLTLCDALLFAVATLAAQLTLRRHFEPLVARNPRHRVAVRAWLVLYAFTGIQLGWVLRPFRGTEGFAVQFLRPEAFEQNAYVVLLEHFLRLAR